MSRFAVYAFALLAGGVAVPALAADYPGLRPAYAPEWEMSEDSLRFEAGIRYWYSLGGQSSEVDEEVYDTTDTSHILEGHFRVDDDYTSTFLKANGGYAAVINGEHVAGTNAPDSFEGGHIGYAGGDFGWTPLGNETVRFGGLIGYQYMRESPDRDRLMVENVDGLNIHALRLGVTSHADLSSMVDIEAEAAFIPYAYAYGATAPIVIPEEDMGGGLVVNRRDAVATGSLYGASGQLMVGFHPTENLTLRVGARAWYLTGPSSMRQREYNALDPDAYVYSDSPLSGFSLFRYGGLAELTGRF
jgi:hypothetical protein